VVLRGEHDTHRAMHVCYLLTSDRYRSTVDSMPSTRRLVRPLRVLLVLAFVVLLAAQLRVLPAMYDDWVRDAPAPAPSPGLLTAGILLLLCVQVVVVCTWKLLALVAADRIFSDRSLVWLDTTLGAVAAAEVLLAGALAHLLLRGGSPGLSGALLIVLVAGAVLGLLVLVLRSLLRQATTLRVELEAVV
jgi:hypothetical protein